MKRLRPALKVIFILIILFSLWEIPQRITINHIECQSQYGECSPRIQELLVHHIGESLPIAKRSLFNELKELVKEDIMIKYQYPRTLLVDVYETEPVFGIANSEATDFRLIDHEGYVVSNAGETSLPFAKTSSNLPQIGDKIEDHKLFALKLLRDLSKSYQLSIGELSDDGLLVALPTGTAVLFPLDGDRDTLLGSFILVINQLNSVKASSTMEKANVIGKTVDLRFKNPVIR